MTRVREVMNAFLESRRFAVLLVAQLFALFVAPMLSSVGTESFRFHVAAWSVVIAGLYAASVRRVLRIVATALVCFALYAWVGPNLLSPRIDELLRLLTIAACFVFTAAVVVDAIARHERVNRETLLGGINVYLLLGFAFMLLHASVEVGHSGSYLVRDTPLLEHVESGYGGRAFATILYFSFTTLTTLGYGDIVPVTDGARLLTSGEALVGQLFIAIFIGRLVGLEVGERTAARRSATTTGAVFSDEGAAEGHSG